jgi:hypothetical protein
MQTTTLTSTPRANRRISLLSDRNVLEKENNVLRQALKCHLCGGNYDHIANGSDQNCTLKNDIAKRLSLEQQGIIKKNNTRIKQTISQRESRFKMRTENPEAYEKQKQQNSAHKAAIRNNEDYRMAERLRAQELRSTSSTTANFYQTTTIMHRMLPLRNRPDSLILEEALEQLDINEDFLNPTYKKTEGEMYNRICKYLSFEYLTNNCCAVCERCKPKAFTLFISVSDSVFVNRLRACVGFTDERRRRMPEKVQANYSLEAYDQRLKGIILSKYGLYRGNDKSPIDRNCFDAVEDMQLCICEDCDIDIGYSTKRNSTINLTINQCITPSLQQYFNDSDSETECSRSHSTVSCKRTRK